jgi:hypothetical protein
MSDLLSQPTFRSTKGRVPIFRPQLKGEELDITVQQAAITLGEDLHDMALLSVTSATMTTTDGLLDAPISFYYGSAPRTELFCGYINAISETKVGNGNISFNLVVFGATQVMQAGDPKFWRNRTVPDIVEALSYNNNLGSFHHNHTYAWPSLAQTSESDWKTATTLASRLGWSVFNRYGVVICVDPAAMLKDNGPYATLQSSQDHDFEPNEARRMIEFNATEKSVTTRENMGEQVAYFAGEAVQVSKEPGNFKTYKFVTNRVINDPTEGSIYVDSASTDTMNWLQEAEARIWGDSDIYPGMPVNVITTNTAYLKAKYDGRWLVRGVKHIMDTQQYQTQFALSRPSSAFQVTQNPYEPFWQKASQSRPGLYLKDNIWISTWTDPRVQSTT